MKCKIKISTILKNGAAVLLGSAMVFGTYMLPLSADKDIITAYAYTQPENLELKIGTVTVDKNEMDEDTVVEVPVSIKNNPGFLALNIVCELDKALKYDKDCIVPVKPLDPTEPGVSNISVLISTNSENWLEKGILEADLMSREDEKVTYDGEIAALRVKVPKNIPEGDYTIRFADGYDDSLYISILVMNLMGASYDSRYFSKLESGGIKVIDSSGPDYILGDVNNDGNIDIEDAVMVINHVNGQKALTSEEAERANVDGSKNVDIEDAVAIISHVNGVKSIS